MKRRILLVGATGAFGTRLARLLARWDVDLILAARRPGPLQALAATLDGRAAVEVVVFDRAAPALAALRPWAVVDAAGPFQTSDLAFARASVAAGAHYVDIADARAFVADFPAALDAEARDAGVLAVTGASSTPALSVAVLDRLTAGWKSVDTTLVAISPGARAPRGVSVVQAILSYVGRPVRVFEAGRWTERPGWSGLHRVYIPGLGRRWASLCETPDLDLIPERFGVGRDAPFLAGLELSVAHVGLWLLSWPVRLGWARSLAPLAGLLRGLAGLLAPMGSDRGGMLVLAEGQGADGAPRRARWSLAAEADAGPNVPVAAAAAVLRALLENRMATRGAHVAAGLVDLDAILRELKGLPIRTETLIVAPQERALFRRALGDRFQRLPAQVARVHGAPGIHRGRGRARGAAWLAPLRFALGLPQPGVYRDLTVAVAEHFDGETWTRAFGHRAFTSRLGPGRELGQFQERLGPVTFTFGTEPITSGFLWRFEGWRLGPLPLPRALAPAIRARAFERDGVYRFSVAVAHPWAGLVFAYAGRLA